jgi:hypothetical protein
MARTQKDAHISIRLSPQARQAVEEIMNLAGLKTVQEAVRRAIGDELFLQQQRRVGWRVLLRKGHDIRELVWSDPA